MSLACFSSANFNSWKRLGTVFLSPINKKLQTNNQKDAFFDQLAYVQNFNGQKHKRSFPFLQPLNSVLKRFILSRFIPRRKVNRAPTIVARKTEPLPGHTPEWSRANFKHADFACESKVWNRSGFPKQTMLPERFCLYPLKKWAEVLTFGNLRELAASVLKGLRGNSLNCAAILRG